MGAAADYLRAGTDQEFLQAGFLIRFDAIATSKKSVPLWQALVGGKNGKNLYVVAAVAALCLCCIWCCCFLGREESFFTSRQDCLCERGERVKARRGLFFHFVLMR